MSKVPPPNAQDVTKSPPAVATVISAPRAASTQMASATPYYQRPMATATATAAKPPGDGYEEVREQVR